MYDPYQTPVSADEPADGSELSLLSAPNRCPASTGWTWIPQAFSIFRERWGMWLLIGLVALLCSLPFTFLEPFLPTEISWILSICSFLLGVFLMCGMVYSAASQVENGELAVSSLFAGFQLKFRQVLVLSLLQLLIFGVLMIPIIWLGDRLEHMPAAELRQNLGVIIGFILLSLILISGMVLATWFTPALVMLHDVPPTRAIAMSVRGGLANLLPLLVYALAMMGFGFMLVLLTFLLMSVMPGILIIAILGLLFIPAALLFSGWNGIISYVSYLSVWTDAEWED